MSQNDPTVGAHEQKDSATDRSWYIIPLCVKHNVSADELTVMESTIFVSANVSLTCCNANRGPILLP
jgi:hypothetical protein